MLYYFLLISNECILFFRGIKSSPLFYLSSSKGLVYSPFAGDVTKEIMTLKSLKKPIERENNYFFFNM